MRHLFILPALALSLCASLMAGPLTPSPGPVSPTPGPEPRTALNATNTPGDADSLFKITQPGSYYLTGNITGVVGKHGIEIAASGVTIDLNGFDLVGVPGMGSFDGVSHSVINLTNIAVVNGSVRNWGQDGVNLVSFSTSGCRVEGVRASGNARAGIYAGSNSLIQNCSASGSLYGIGMTSGGIVSGCSVTTAFVVGFLVGENSTLSNCTSYNNADDGIATGGGSTITNCSANNNAGDGITVGGGSTVTNCSAFANTGNGIVVASDCSVINNTCDNNGASAGSGAGIYVTGNDNRIEGNNCIDADRGIDVDGSGNFIIRNICSGNTTNWEVAAGNTCLVVSATQTVLAINGNSGGAAPGSTDPNANFTY